MTKGIIISRPKSLLDAHIHCCRCQSEIQHTALWFKKHVCVNKRNAGSTSSTGCQNGLEANNPHSSFYFWVRDVVLCELPCHWWVAKRTVRITCVGLIGMRNVNTFRLQKLFFLLLLSKSIGLSCCFLNLYIDVNGCNRGVFGLVLAPGL